MLRTTILKRVSKLEEKGTDIEFELRVREVEEWYAEKKEIYNSPEQEELRKKEYEKILAEGNARKERMYNHDCKQ